MICDAHCDTLFRLMEGKRENLDITFERLEAAGVTLQVFAMFVGYDNTYDVIKSQNEKMLMEFDRFIQKGVHPVKDISEIQENKVNGMLSLEGCECLINEKALEFYYDKGVRMAAVTWNFDNIFATPACVDQSKGLKAFGREMLKEMQNRKIAVDVSHLNEAGFYELIENFEKPILASHSNAATLCNHVRNLTDDQLRVLFAKGGYVGINFYPEFLSNTAEVNLDTVIDHMLYMMDRGGYGKIGFGSDFDGIAIKPVGLNNPLELANLINRMYERGLTQSEVEGISGKNLIAYFERL